jgi:hypothetical protein
MGRIPHRHPLEARRPPCPRECFMYHMPQESRPGRFYRMVSPEHLIPFFLRWTAGSMSISSVGSLQSACFVQWTGSYPRIGWETFITAIQIFWKMHINSQVDELERFCITESSSVACDMRTGWSPICTGLQVTPSTECNMLDSCNSSKICDRPKSQFTD